MTNNQADADATGKYKENRGKIVLPIKNDREKIFTTRKQSHQRIQTLLQYKLQHRWRGRKL